MKRLAFNGFCGSVAGRPARGGALAAGVMALTAFASHAAAADHPDLTGVWMVQQPYYLGQRLLPEPSLTPQAAAQTKRRREAAAKGYVRSVGNMLCEGGGGPSLFTVRSPFEVFAGFGRMTFIFETETFNQPRTVYLNEGVQPPDIFPSPNGHSIGHWEGQALVVDTVAFNDRGGFPGGVPRSDKAHLVERFTLEDGGKVLADQLTMEDPVNLAQPWTTTLKFDRMADTEERFEVTCDVDLEALKTVDLNAVKDADPEAARLLDPAKRGDDPALKYAQKPAP